MRGHIELSVVIVNYNGETCIKSCLDSLLSARLPFPYDIWVVDNGSSDQSLPLLKRYGPQINLITYSENKGFAAANNDAASQSTGDYLLFLNNDTVSNAEAVSKLYHYYMAHPYVGAIGPRLMTRNGKPAPVGGFLGRWQYWGHWPRKVSFLPGAALMIKREWFNQVGGFDTQFFFYHEDLDLCRRLNQAHLPTYYLPQANIIHEGGISSQNQKNQLRQYATEGFRYYCKKHYPNWIYKLACQWQRLSKT